MDKESYGVRMASWASIITEANNSGMHKTEWCRQHNISIRSFHYWKTKIRRYLLEHPDMSTVDMSNPESYMPPATNTPSFYEIELKHETPAVQCGNAIPAHASSPMLVLSIGQFQLHIADGFSEDTLASVIKVVKNA